MQYSIRNVPAVLDRALRRRAKDRGASLNEVALEALARGIGVSDEAVPQRRLRDLAGTWEDDAIFDAALDEQRIIDACIWR